MPVPCRPPAVLPRPHTRLRYTFMSLHLPSQARQGPEAEGLDRLTEPLDVSEADRGASEDREGEVDVVAALVADDQAAATGDPGQGAFDHPAVPPQAFAALDPASGDPGDDAAPAASATAAGIVVGFVGVQLLRTAPGPATGLADRRHSVERLLEHDAVVDVGGREQDRQRDALPVHDEVALAARLAAVGRVRPGRGPAGLWRAGSPRRASTGSSRSARPCRAGRAARGGTPARC